MTTRPNVTTSIDTRIVGTQDIAFMRPIVISFAAVDCKPRTRLFPSFDGERIDELIQPDGGAIGDVLITDEYGRLNGRIHIPGRRFRTGERVFLLNEHPHDAFPLIAGMASGTAAALFTSNGLLHTVQTTVTERENITLWVDPPPPPQPVRRRRRRRGWLRRLLRAIDPIAQTFDTFGIENGCFLHSLELYFRERDENVPVVVEIRETVNAVPGPNLIHPENARVSLLPSQVSVSADASIPTIVKFPRLLYLPPDREYCFVVITPSTNYYMYTAQLGERSIENGRIVHEQSHLGSMFRSQNNRTWTPSQFEDVKFKLNVCKFNTTAPATITVAGDAETCLVDCDSFTTIAGSNIVTFTSRQRHGLDLSSSAFFEFDTRGVYNGIPATALSGARGVVSIIDERSFTFSAGANATVTGPILNGGFVSSLFVEAPGLNYRETPLPQIVFSGGEGTGATARGIVRDGRLIGAVIVSGGSGYTAPPAVAVNDANGSGAIVIASLYTQVIFQNNNIAHRVLPAWAQLEPTSTRIRSELRPMLGNFPGSTINNYAQGRVVSIDYNTKTEFDQNLLIASTPNRQTILGAGAQSSVFNMQLSSTSENVSPVIDLRNFRAVYEENQINNQFNENILSQNSTGSVISGTVINGGLGFVAPVTTQVVSVDGHGSGATVTLAVTGGAISGITVTNGGSGYRQPPRIVISGQTPTVQAQLQLNLSEFNSELHPQDGRAVARYITKTQKLLNVATGARVILEAYSSANTSIDVYFRGSQASSNIPHRSSPWRLMNSPTARNLSRSRSEFVDYTFSLDSFPGGFDMFQYKIVLRSRVPFDAPVIRNLRTLTVI